MATKIADATQKFVPVKEIRNGVVFLKDGGYRGILMCSSINFGLKSVDEQHAITLGFQNFLNTLDFSIQIIINSRKMDLRPYLSILGEKVADQKTELMRIQLHEYIEFVRTFADQANIMTKMFYIVVPYARSAAINIKNTFGVSETRPVTGAGAIDVDFDKDRIQLEQRMSLVASGLSGTGVRAVPLGTEEVIELLYRSFNPGELENPIRLDA